MEDVRVEEGTLPNYVTDVLLAEIQRLYPAQNVEVAFANAGAFRSGFLVPGTFNFSSESGRIGNKFGPGVIPDDEIKGWWPFNNDTVIMDITGQQLKNALEAAVRSFADDAGTVFGPDLGPADTGGWLLHISGISYEVTCNATTRIKIGPAGCDPFMGQCSYQNQAQANSISKITFGATLIYDASAAGNPWQNCGSSGTCDNRVFRVVMNSFLAAGGDLHLDFAAGANRFTIPQAQFDFAPVLVAYMRGHSPVPLAAKTGRIVVKGLVGGLKCNLPARCTAAHKPCHPNCAHLP
jgi:hypothetical protein